MSDNNIPPIQNPVDPNQLQDTRPFNQPQQPQIPNQPQPDPNYVGGGHNPEQAPIYAAPVESAPIVEMGIEQELDPEVQEFMQRVETDKVELNEPIVMHGSPIVSPPHWQNSSTVKLPTSKQTIINNVKGKATQSITWLANWCLRIIKKFNGQVIYTDPEPPLTPPSAA